MDDMGVLIAKRVVLGVVTLFVISIIVFLGVEMLPGDLAEALLGRTSTPETIAALREQLGLNLPAHVRYLDWISGLASGDLGTSLATKRQVADLLAPRLANTLFLAAVAAIISVPLAIILGVASTLYRESWVDRIISIVTLSFVCLPEFFIAYVLILIFSVKLSFFPSLSMINDSMGLWDRLYITFLPALTLTLVVIAQMMRMTRAAIMSVLSSPYIETARLKGLSGTRIIVWHALPNALSPIINVVAVNLAYLLVGVVIVEVVFVYPGLGQLLVDSVAHRDLPVVQASVLIFALAYVVLNLLADVLSILANPRLLYPR